MIFLKTLLTLSLCAGLAAQANTVSDLQASNPSLSPYQILQTLYNQSNHPALITDFDLASDPRSNQICVDAIVDSTRPYDFFIGRIQADDSRGPLFPAAPKSYLSFTTQSRTALANIKHKTTQSDTVTITSTDLVDTFIDTTYSPSPIILAIRKNGALIAVHITIDAGTTKQTDAYAYCYRQ